MDFDDLAEMECQLNAMAGQEWPAWDLCKLYCHSLVYFSGELDSPWEKLKAIFDYSALMRFWWQRLYQAQNDGWQCELGRVPGECDPTALKQLFLPNTQWSMCGTPGCGRIFLLPPISKPVRHIVGAPQKVIVGKVKGKFWERIISKRRKTEAELLSEEVRMIGPC